MAESSTPRLDLPRWTADTDTPNRVEFDRAFERLEERAAGFLAGPIATTRPAAGAAVARFYHYDPDTDLLTVCVDTTGAGGWAWVEVAQGGRFVPSSGGTFAGNVRAPSFLVDGGAWVSVSDALTGGDDLGFYAGGIERLSLSNTGLLRLASGGALVYPDGTSHSSAAAGVLAFATSAVSLPNATWTEIGFGGEDFDVPGGSWSGPGPQPSLVVNQTPAGRYLLLATVMFSSHATGDRGVQFLRNGNNLRGTQIIRAGSGGTDFVMQASMVQTLAPNDVVKVRAYQTSGTTLSAAAQYSWGALIYLGG